MSKLNQFLKIIFFVTVFFIPIQLIKAENFYAAIFVDEQTGTTGTVYNLPTERESIKKASAICKKKSKKKYCESILLFSNGCGAAAWSPKNKSARGATAETSSEVAGRKALKRCREAENDPNCKLVAYVCTNWETWETTTTTTWW